MIVSLACSNLMEVKGPSYDVLSQSVSPGVENIMYENTIYSFRVLVFNSVGVVSTNIRHIVHASCQFNADAITSIVVVHQFTSLVN